MGHDHQFEPCETRLLDLKIRFSGTRKLTRPFPDPDFMEVIQVLFYDGDILMQLEIRSGEVLFVDDVSEVLSSIGAVEAGGDEPLFQVMSEVFRNLDLRVFRSRASVICSMTSFGTHLTYFEFRISEKTFDLDEFRDDLVQSLLVERT